MTDERTVRHIYRWDLDKTYLATEFDSLKDLVRTAFQKPEEKTNVPGADALLRELTRTSETERVILTFISGSPSQMRTTLAKKFELDGITPDAFILKPWISSILKGRFKAVKGQVGYKLEALLRVRTASPDAPETLFGDDSEQDAFIYALYADVVNGSISKDVLRDILVEAEVYASPIEKILALSEVVEQSDKIQRIFIHLDRRSAPGRFRVFGPRVVPIANYFQVALVLYADDTIDVDALLRIAKRMMDRDGYDLTALANSFQDLVRRQFLGQTTISRLAEDVAQAEEIGLPSGFMDRFVSRVRALAPRGDDRGLDWVGPPDYLEVLRSDRALHQAVTQKKRPGLFKKK